MQLNSLGSAAACGAMLMIAPAAFAAPGEEIATPIAACIKDNAAKVEQAIPSLTEATDFLIAKVCAAPVAAETARRATEEWRATMKDLAKQCAEWKTKKNDVTPKPDVSGDPDAPLDPCTSLDGYKSPWNLTNQIMLDRRTHPDVITLAAKTLLDLRAARLKAEAVKEAR